MRTPQIRTGSGRPGGDSLSGASANYQQGEAEVLPPEHQVCDGCRGCQLAGGAEIIGWTSHHRERACLQKPSSKGSV